MQRNLLVRQQRVPGGMATTSGSCQIGSDTMPSPTSAACENPMVKSPDRSPRTCSANGTSDRRISISGSSSRQRARNADSRGSIAPSDTAMRSLPCEPAATALTFSRACSKTVNNLRTSCRKATPAEVSRVPLRFRSKSTTPNSSSSPSKSIACIAYSLFVSFLTRR